MSVSFTYGSYKFTISTPSAITVTEAGLNTYFKSAYVPTVKRNKSGTAITRYIHFELESANMGHEIAVYKAVFTKTGTTATVTAYSSPNVRMGEIANDKLIDGMNKLFVHMSSSVSGDSEGVEISMPINVNLYPTVTLAQTKSQSSPNPSTFGYIKGFCTGRVTATVKTTFAYTGGSVYVGLSSISMSGNGVSSSTTSINIGVMNSTSVTVSCTAKNSRGLTNTKTITLTCQDYVKPALLSCTALRDDSNSKNANITVGYRLHSTNQLGTTGDIKVNYTIKSGNTTIKSGSHVICASGTSLSSLTGTATFAVTGGLLDDDTNYDLSVTIVDRVTTGNTVYDIITSTFRIIHIGANGKGVGIGGAAPNEGVKVYGGLETETINGIAAVFGTVTGGAGASSLTFTNADLIGKSFMVCTAMDVNCVIASATFTNKNGTASIDGAVRINFSAALSVTTRINYIAW